MDVRGDRGGIAWVDEFEGLHTADGRAGIGADEPGLHPVEEFAGCASCGGGRDVGYQLISTVKIQDLGENSGVESCLRS